MAGRILRGTAAAVLVWMGVAGMAGATEYDMPVYVLPDAALSGAIGSGDAALRDAMLADQDYIDNMALDERFYDELDWREAVTQLIAGQDGRADMTNGFAVELLLRQLTPPGDRFAILMPFADLSVAGEVMLAAGKEDAAWLLDRLSTGVLPADGGLAARIGPSDYHAQVSLVPPADMARARDALPQIRQVADLLNEAMQEPGSAVHAQAETILETVIRADLARYTPSEPMSPAQIEASVAQRLSDPYFVRDPVIFLAEDLDTIQAALDRAADKGETAVFVYRSW
ncbi:MAG: hypothetical protein Q4G25_14810 [Paracoccus sp. (in: a-proteobacteria)]|nr:hypothetical protein [Paracoccus sp. (in: a-proteobacteria)]